MNCSDLTISANHDQAVHNTGLNVPLSAETGGTPGPGRTGAPYVMAVYTTKLHFNLGKFRFGVSEMVLGCTQLFHRGQILVHDHCIHPG